MLELVSRCKAGDTKGFELLAQRVQPWALQYAKALLGDESLARDAMQEALITVFLKIKTLRHDEAFVPWFRCVLRTQCNRILRRRREVLVGSSVFNGCSADPAGDYAIEEMRRMVGEAIAHLPAPRRDAVNLFYIKERSVAEVARLLKVPAGTVKRRLFDARRQLKHLLADQLPLSALELEPAEEPGTHTGKPITIL